MTDEPLDQPPPNEPPQDEAGGPPPLTDEERAMLEAQMKEIRVEDLLTQTVASVLNLSARRIVKEDEVDLDQARIGIEAVRAIVALLPAEVGQAIAEPLSQVQLLYAQRSGETGEPGGEEGATGGAGPSNEPPAGHGPSKLWTPGS
ncbi:MAG TPA: hypothetical protein PKA56_06660 [Solirubrobacterales bacterium]|jgi:hypothetical protein|nr:hypothetical protein [Solirubrobacterales bacterium]HMU27007.1 hypothetical protein [Solirubrobacterales bacterium]HMW44901.1 hypothetical protein [Solirubrobacterales bacterium]HMX71416.1 hypothetical protein [Solirubrobacterales bacterium]HMY26343.1 hypothetical protein [Solirubrobacterales bacterium]